MRRSTGAGSMRVSAAAVFRCRRTSSSGSATGSARWRTTRPCVTRGVPRRLSVVLHAGVEGTGRIAAGGQRSAAALARVCRRQRFEPAGDETLEREGHDVRVVSAGEHFAAGDAQTCCDPPRERGLRTRRQGAACRCGAARSRASPVDVRLTAEAGPQTFDLHQSTGFTASSFLHRHSTSRT